MKLRSGFKNFKFENTFCFTFYLFATPTMADKVDNNSNVNEFNIEPNPITNAVLSIINNVEAPLDITQILQIG